MSSYVQTMIRQFEARVADHRYLTCINAAETTDEYIVKLVDFDGGKGSAERRISGEAMGQAPLTELDAAWESAAAELDKRRAHADTEPQNVGRASAVHAHALTGGGTFDEGLRVVTVNTAGSPLTIKANPVCSQGDVYLVDTKSGHVSRMTNVSPDAERQLAVAGVVRTKQTHGPVDPLDVEYDGRTLRLLLEWDEAERRETTIGGLSRFTPAQRAAISAHWSAELRARTEAAKQQEREQVVSDYGEDRP